MSEKIAVFNLKSLTQDEIFGFLSDVASLIGDTFTTKPVYVTDFLSSFQAFEDAMNTNEPFFTSTDLAQADNNADNAWNYLNAYLKAMVNHPRQEASDAARRIWATFSQFENPTALAYAAEYSIMERLISALGEIPADIIAKANAADWINRLRDNCSTFVQMYAMHLQDKEFQVTGLVKATKTNAIQSYRELTSIINAMLIVSPNDDMICFTRHLNKLIEAREKEFKSRMPVTETAGQDRV